jgi:hypothetical protein
MLTLTFLKFTSKPELFRGYDPKHKIFNSVIHDLEPLEVTDSDAEIFKEHGDNCDIWAGEGGQWFVKLKKGARVYPEGDLLQSTRRWPTPHRVERYTLRHPRGHDRTHCSFFALFTRGHC